MSRGGSCAPRIGSPPTPPSTIITSLCGSISTLTGGNIDSNRQLSQLAKTGVAAIQKATTAKQKSILAMRLNVIIDATSCSIYYCPILLLRPQWEVVSQFLIAKESH